VLSEDQLVSIRRHVGDQPDDAALNSIFDRVGDVDELVLEVLQIRLANLEANPTQFTVVGEYSQDSSKNLEALTAKVGSIGGGSRVRIVEPCRGDPR
jgi:hypothetical protein